MIQQLEASTKMAEINFYSMTNGVIKSDRLCKGTFKVILGIFYKYV